MQNANKNELRLTLRLIQIVKNVKEFLHSCTNSTVITRKDSVWWMVTVPSTHVSHIWLGPWWTQNMPGRIESINLARMKQQLWVPSECWGDFDATLSFWNTPPGFQLQHMSTDLKQTFKSRGFLNGETKEIILTHSLMLFYNHSHNYSCNVCAQWTIQCGSFSLVPNDPLLFILQTRWQCPGASLCLKGIVEGDIKYNIATSK